MNDFPICPWTSSKQDMLNAITPQTANLPFDGVPVLAIAALKVCPDVEVVQRLLQMGANKAVKINGVPILELAASNPRHPESTHSTFLALFQQDKIGDTIQANPSAPPPSPNRDRI